MTVLPHNHDSAPTQCCYGLENLLDGCKCLRTPLKVHVHLHKSTRTCTGWGLRAESRSPRTGWGRTPRQCSQCTWSRRAFEGARGARGQQTMQGANKKPCTQKTRGHAHTQDLSTQTVTHTHSHAHAQPRTHQPSTHASMPAHRHACTKQHAHRHATPHMHAAMHRAPRSVSVVPAARTYSWLVGL